MTPTWDSDRRGYFLTRDGDEWQWICSGYLGLAFVRARAARPVDSPADMRVLLHSGEWATPESWENALWRIDHRRRGRRQGAPDRPREAKEFDHGQTDRG